MAKKKIIYTIEREFLKKYEIRQSVGLIIAQYIRDGRKNQNSKQSEKQSDIAI